MSQPADSSYFFPIGLIFYIFGFVSEPIFSFSVTTGSNPPVNVSSTHGTSGCLNNFRSFLPDKLDYVRHMDAKEDVRDLGQHRPRLDTFQTIMFLLRSERAFHPRCTHSCQLVVDDVVIFLHEGRTASLHKRSLYPFLPAVLPVGVAGIACISSDFLRIHSDELPVIFRQCGSLVSSLKALNDNFSMN